jgi:uncharacterized iron-regulated membrane protein
MFKLTKYIFRWHHWCGLIVGIFLLMMSITGSMLVFSEEWELLEERQLNIATATGEPGFDSSIGKIQSRYPGWEIRMYHLPEKEKALVYELRQKENRIQVWADPVNGNILAVNEKANKAFHRQLLLLHYTLFSGTTGKIIVFFTGLLFLVTLITGLIVYRKSIVRALLFRVRFNRRTKRSYYSSLHRILGVWTLIFNLLIVLTGLWLAGQVALTAIKSTPANTAKQTSATMSSLDEMVKKTGQEFPDFEIHLIRIRPGNTNVQFSGRLLSDPGYYGSFYSGFTIDGTNGKIISGTFMKDLPLQNKLSKMAGPLHFGNYGGMAVKIIYCILGLAPGFLAISGFILWRKRQPSRSKKDKASLSV